MPSAIGNRRTALEGDRSINEPPVVFHSTPERVTGLDSASMPDKLKRTVDPVHPLNAAGVRTSLAIAPGRTTTTASPTTDRSGERARTFQVPTFPGWYRPPTTFPVGSLVSQSATSPSGWNHGSEADAVNRMDSSAVPCHRSGLSRMTLRGPSNSYVTKMD